ncbi:hypothetical protein EMPS_05674 [Entomortierella parvispora]|uniref:C2H2-type domain-containing protein n=1 Tax=Entomortierella parvispora TaxID=205924 RepID=A0A9P3LWJ1_9FUNG|nr:hypothetical protein EMPS_05674 [Entomortierella parvispora]
MTRYPSTPLRTGDPLLQRQDLQQEQQLQQQQQQTCPIISLALSRFSHTDCTASLVFSLQEEDPNKIDPLDATATATAASSLAPWNSIYIPKHYRVPIPGQRQSSPGECDLVLKIFPRINLPSQDSESTARSQDLAGPCNKCKTRDIFQIEGPDPAVPSPQRLFFSAGEIRLTFRICCPPSHHSRFQIDEGYILTFQLHHGKRILMSKTVKKVGPGMAPEAIPLDPSHLATPLNSTRAPKRKPSSEPNRPESDNTALPRKRSTVMSLANLITDAPSLPSSPSPQTEGIITPSVTTTDPSSPTAVVPLSPKSLERENTDTDVHRPRKNSPSYDDHTPASWVYGKDSRSGSERTEDSNAQKASMPTAAAPKQAKKRQEPHELSELGIGQRASANLHAAYVSSQLKERSKSNGTTVPSVDNTAKTKASTKPKPSHACPEPDCDKSFSRLFNLRSHMRTHSKARPFVCASCNFAFSRRHDRDRHAKKHLSEKPYKCIVCEATFVRQDALVRHLRMDGVQNTCMAAMEQRAMQLGENGNGYMLAATQQVHDEQEQEDRDADERQLAAKSAMDISNNRKPVKGAAAGRNTDSEVKDDITKSHSLQDQKSADALLTLERSTAQPSSSRSSTPPKAGKGLIKNVDMQGPGQVKSEDDQQVKGEYAGHSGDQGSNNNPGEEHYDSAPYNSTTSPSRSFYPSPSLSHSRSHSQSQLHPPTTEYARHEPHQQHYYHYPDPYQHPYQQRPQHPHPYSHPDQSQQQFYHHPQANHGAYYDMGPDYPHPTPPAHVYLGPPGSKHSHPYPPTPNHSYGGQSQQYSYPESGAPHQYQGPPQGYAGQGHENSREAMYQSYGSSEGNPYDRHRHSEDGPESSHNTGRPTETDEEHASDKTVYDAAMGLLTIQRAHW